MRLHVNQRHDRVLDVVRARGSVKVADLAEELGVSAVTVRRDVEALAAQGRIERAHGTVSWPQAGVAAAPSAPAVAPRAVSAPGAGGEPVLGIVVPSMEYYFAELVRGAQEAVAACGGRLVVGISNWVPAEDAVQVGQLLDGGVQGLLLQPAWELGLPSAEQERQLLELPVPAVLLERRIPVGGRLAHLDVVRSDHALGSAAGVHHLADLGHESVALLVRRDSPTVPLVREGYEAAVAARELPVIEPIEMHPAVSPAGLDAAAKRLLALDGVTAALVHNDQDAIGIVQRLRAAGLRIPEDMALVAYEDELAGLSDVPLTAVAPPRRAVGRAAAELLLARLAEAADGTGGGARDDSPRRHLALMPRLRVRESSGVA
ncbi:substrate-binding domain-containing protein [Streptomyces sp. NPDC051684]|uniref:substrate-binding domain-containing protein n=1 Tax=Streptomyces sp. NPDC051684 TaxID=3365670 RepID=UPI0037AADFE0